MDQLRRAALSVSLNIAEGSGRYHKKDKKNFYYFAWGSLFECIPILTILRNEKALTDQQYDAVYQSSHILAKMLTRLIQSVDRQQGPEQS